MCVCVCVYLSLYISIYIYVYTQAYTHTGRPDNVHSSQLEPAHSC